MLTDVSVRDCKRGIYFERVNDMVVELIILSVVKAVKVRVLTLTMGEFVIHKVVRAGVELLPILLRR